MPSSNYGRLFTISAVSTVTTFESNLFLYDDYQPDYFTLEVFSVDQGEWVATVGGVAIGSPSMAADLLPADRFGFASNYAGSADRIALTDPAGVVGLHLFLVNAADATMAARFEITQGENLGDGRLAFGVTGGQLTGADFALAAGSSVTLFIETFGTQSITTSTTRRRVWGRISERGAIPGLIGLGQGAASVTETAEIHTRYDPALAIASTIQDDLSRVWTVVASRNSADRRELTYECTRDVLRGGLPA